MKNRVCLLLALVLCLSGIAFAATPSKTTKDMSKFVVETKSEKASEENPNLFLMPVNEATVSEKDMVDYQTRLDICNKELEKLQNAENPLEYFGTIVDADGAEVSLEPIEGTKLSVTEFSPIVAGNFVEEMGEIKATLLFPTVFEENEIVGVLIGLVTVEEDGTQTVKWTVFNGIGVKMSNETEGAISTTLTPEIVKAIEDGIALLAIVRVVQ